MWLEMSRDNDHGGGSWGFTQCLWSPTYKQATTGKQGSKWPFWENLLHVKAGDQILHLRGEGRTASFTGLSVAATDGYVTTERPPSPGPWAYSTEYYRVQLQSYTLFQTPILLRNVFQRQDAALREYFYANRQKSRIDKQSIFYVIQSGRVQCLNGAYLSEVDDSLLAILLGDTATSNGSIPVQPQTSTQFTYLSSTTNVSVGATIRELFVREGQQRFSLQVRLNYEKRCAFPGCTVDESAMLVGAHIARWADVPELRGELSNGICWCLIHDKAFEIGLFTLTSNLTIAINQSNPLVQQSPWAQANLIPFDGQHITTPAIPPSNDALAHHWSRIGFTPSEA